MMKNAYFILKALSVLKIFKFLSAIFGHVGKTASNLVYKQLQYTYYQISHEEKVTRQ